MRDTLTCNGYELDLHEKVPFPITFSLADYKSPEKRKRTYTTAITLKGTARNKAFFAESYGYHSFGGNTFFDATKRVSAVYEKNGLPIINDGVLQLVNVTIKNGSPEFKVQVYSEGVDIFLLLSNIRLVDLPWGDLNHTLTRTNIKNSWSTPDGAGYRYPLIIYRTQLAPLVWRTTDLVPYVHFVEIIKRMFDFVGVTYESNFFNSSAVKKLLYGFGGGDYINKTLTTQEVISRQVNLELNDEVNTTLSYPWQGIDGDIFNSPISEPKEFSFEDIDLTFNIITDDTYQYQSNSFVINKSGNYEFLFESEIYYQAKLTTNEQYTGLFAIGNPSIVIRRNGVDVLEQVIDANDVKTNYNISNPSTYPTLDVDVQVEYISYFNSGDEIEVIFKTPTAQVGGVTWYGVGTLEYDFKIAENSCYVYLNSRDIAVTDGSVIALTRFLPDVKCSEFLLSAFRQFNLMMSEPDEVTGVVTIEPEIDFYTDPTDVWDISDIIDYSKPFEIEPIANTVSKLTSFEFKQLDEYDAEFYRDKWEREYGNFELINPSYYAKGETKQTLAWGTIVPFQISTQSTGNIVCPRFITFDDNGNAKPNKGVGRLVFWNGLKSGQWSLRNNENATGELLSTYPCIHHFDNYENPTQDLNFSLVDEFRYQGNFITTANSYNLYYRNFYSNMISRHGKLVRCFVKIDAFDMKQRNMRKLVMINESLFKINKLGAFDSNISGTTEIELIRVVTPRNFNTSTLPNVGYNGWGIDVILGVQNEVGVGAGFIGNIKDDVGKYAKFLKSN